MTVMLQFMNPTLSLRRRLGASGKLRSNFGETEHQHYAGSAERVNCHHEQAERAEVVVPVNLKAGTAWALARLAPALKFSLHGGANMVRL